MSDDITSRARAALEGVTQPWRWSGGEDDDPAVVFIDAAPRLMSELLAEVERLRGALDRLKVEWLENYEYEGGDGGGPTGYVFKACADGLRAVLRGDQ